jgi:hypothetical protein
VFAACALAVMATRYVRIGVALTGAAGLAICIWALQVYMPLAGTHWGMRTPSAGITRTVSTARSSSTSARQFADEWSRVKTAGRSTMIPDTLHIGQP